MRGKFCRGAVLLVMLGIGGFCQSARAAGEETVREAICRLIDNAARERGLPGDFFTRLIWRESAFRAQVVSPAGAQGIAQFMPGTARERGLADPFDPERAIPESARLLADLREEFGNLGLAAAAYNAGPARVHAWLSGTRGLPDETRTYVRLVTGKSAEDWVGVTAREPASGDHTSCSVVVADLRRGRRDLDQPNQALAFAPIAPWGVQLSGNFSKEIALRSFQRVAGLYVRAIGEVQPMIIGTRLRSRGTRAFYRVRVPAQTRQEAEAKCSRIRSVGGSCIVLAS